MNPVGGGGQNASVRTTRPAVAAGCALAVVGCGPGVTVPRDTAPVAGRASCAAHPCGVTTATVVRVVDGDTLILHGQGRVRLIGMDAPETWLRHDCFGARAAQALRRLTPPGSAVRVGGDVEPRDRYGRRLLYVWTPRGVFVNAALVRTGFARALAVPPDTSHATTIRDAEDAARRTSAGLWHACAGRHRPVPTRRARPPVAGGIRPGARQ